MSIWKKLFHANHIKDAKPEPEPETTCITNDKLTLTGYKCSCEAVQDHINAFLYDPDRLNRRLYIGQINHVFPNCILIANGRNYGQVQSIGYTFETQDVVVNTEAGRLVIKRS